MSTNNNYSFINYLRGQQLKAEDVNRIQKWLEHVEKKVLPERINIGNGKAPSDEDTNSSNYKLHINKDSKKLYFKTTNDDGDISWDGVLPHCAVNANEVAFLQSRRKIAQFLYSDFKDSNGNYQVGQYKSNSGVISKSGNGLSSGLLKIIPGKDFYVGYIEDKTNIGCFFNAYKEPVKIVTSSDIVNPPITADSNKKEILYKINNDSSEYEFFCYNLASESKKKNRYRQFVTSKNLLCLEDSGNYVIYEDDPIYQQKKDKNLLVVGASGVSRNRNCYGDEGYESDNSAKVSIGFQEYLKLWYKSVKDAGYAGYSWRYDEDADSDKTGIQTIPRKLFNNNDEFFKKYDDYLFIPSTAGIKGWRPPALTGGKAKGGISCYISIYNGFKLEYKKIYGKTANKEIYDYNFYFPAIGKHTDCLSVDIPNEFGAKINNSGGTYFEGLNTTIRQIREKRAGLPTNFYVANGAKKSREYYYAEGKKTAEIKDAEDFKPQSTYLIINELNRLIALACAEYDYTLIDMAEAGFSRQNYEKLTCDGTHLNNEGNRIQGLTIRKQIIGI